MTTATQGLRPTDPAEIPAVGDFLRGRLGRQDDAAFARDDMLVWKYVDAPRRWAQARSFVFERDGRIVAHAGLCPTVFTASDGGTRTAATVIDWAADQTVPGVGVAIYRAVTDMADIAFLIGGTAATRALTARMGFVSSVEVPVYSRWVRPFSEFIRRRKTGRSFMRLAHGLLHNARRLARARDVAIEVATSFSEGITAVLDARPGTHQIALRTPAELNHRLACPTPPHCGFTFTRDGATIGYALAAIGTWEAKLLDIRVLGNDEEDLASSYGLVTHALMQEPTVCRISAIASVPILQRALARNGYWFSRAESASFRLPPADLRELLPLSIQFFESDLGYINA
jgi:hypothetical protein